MQSGAITVLAFTDWAGNLTAAGQSTLRMMALPVYVVTLFLLARHARQFLVAVRRNLPVALLLAMPFASVLWSVSPSMTLRRAIGLALSIMLAYLIAIRFTPWQFLVLLAIMLGFCMGLSLILAVVSPSWAYMPFGSELRGVFNHKNALGWNAAFAVLVAGALIADGSLGLRRPAIVLLLASLACLLLSHSTTGFVTAGSAILFAALYYALARARGAGKIVLVLVGIQAVALVVLSVDILLGVVVEGAGKDASLTGRKPLWALVDQAISQRFVLGYGYEAFWTEANPAAWFIWAKVEWMAPHAHNGFRDAMLSLGVAGTALLVVVIARALWQGAVLHCRHPQEGWLWLNVLICVSVVMNLTESIFLAPNSFPFIIFLAAVLMTSMRQSDA